MKNRLRLACALSLFALTACVSASKDVYFRSRLPTQESPLLLPAETGAWGLDVDLESDRFKFSPTNNLVTNYKLYDDVSYPSRGGAGVDGADASVTYRRSLDKVILKGAASFDFVELQANPSALLSLPPEWFVNVNVGLYETAAGLTKGSSCFICFQTDENNRHNAELAENSIDTAISGHEAKIGAQVGYVWQEKHVLSLSYQWMDYTYGLTVRKDGAPDLVVDEKFYGSGFGAGYFYRWSPLSLGGVTVDQVDVSWRGRAMQTTVVGLRASIGFR